MNTAELEPINHPSPAIISNMTAISTMKCPTTINGPALEPIFNESDIVTVNIGPGTSAPDRPTTKEVKANNSTSIKLSSQDILKKN